MCYVCNTISCRERCAIYAILFRVGKSVSSMQYYFVQGKVCYVCTTRSYRERCVMYAKLVRAGKGVLCMQN